MMIHRNLIFRAKEVAFYEEVSKNYPTFCQWIARYNGVKEVEGRGQFMMLEDLTYGYTKPSVIDLKIGTKTWEEDAPQEKIDRESKKYPLQRTIGFRLTGMRVFNRETKQYDVYDKKYGYSITLETLNAIFGVYFSQVSASCKKNVIGSIIDQLRPILEWFEVPGRLRFICASLLFILEGDAEEDYRPIVRLVDFAHVKQLPDTERDEGCIVGLKRIIHELEILHSSL